MAGQLLEQWLKATDGKGATRTREERERLVKNHLRPRLGGVKLAKLNSLHIEAFYGDMRRDQVGAHTIRSVADVLSITLNYSVRMKLIPVNPAAAVPKPKTPKRDMLILDESQAKALRAAGRTAVVGPLIAVALGSGCRQKGSYLR